MSAQYVGLVGLADVLEALGGAIDVDVDDDLARAALERTGFTFLFAPCFHPAMRHAGPLRKALGIRTVFNLVGPLANPGLLRPARLTPTPRPSPAHRLADVTNPGLDWLRESDHLSSRVGL